ncbi:hypothetical protein ACWE42_12060 [Sutcliffiella cohnii]
MSLGIRVYVSKKYIDIYRELIKDKPSSPKIFNENRDLFTLSCLIGYQSGKSNSTVEKREQLLWSGTLDPYQETVLKAIAVKSSDDNTLSVLDKPDEVYKIAEKYADRGMEILVEEVFEDYIEEREDGTLTVVYNNKSLLQKELMYYIDSKKTDDPF